MELNVDAGLITIAKATAITSNFCGIQSTEIMMMIRMEIIWAFNEVSHIFDFEVSLQSLKNCLRNGSLS